MIFYNSIKADLHSRSAFIASGRLQKKNEILYAYILEGFFL
jgi:hypothetical protein